MVKLVGGGRAVLHISHVLLLDLLLNVHDEQVQGSRNVLDLCAAASEVVDGLRRTDWVGAVTAVSLLSALLFRAAGCSLRFFEPRKKDMVK